MTRAVIFDWGAVLMRTVDIRSRMAWERRLGIDRGETTPDREFDLDTVACVGCCTMAPVTVVDGTPQARVDPTRVDGILLSFGVDVVKDESEDSQKH